MVGGVSGRWSLQDHDYDPAIPVSVVTPGPAAIHDAIRDAIPAGIGIRVLCTVVSVSNINGMHDQNKKMGREGRLPTDTEDEQLPYMLLCCY